MKITNSVGYTPTPKITATAQAPVSKSEAQISTKKDVMVDNYIDINSKLAATSDVDLAKVNEIRDQLKAGTLTLDIDKLSDAILAMHRR
ncbi:flagellar biosynthesis anti-sigma factor FlgM [Thalassotalea sp. PLHSN55]|uniref:flagellar biosynthesis anti-sigma factor FlgM n=1 Tax=Thalassotalea sp. PLHSN55 TaxID=3435888 RepID=UPI003F830BCE